MKEDDLKGNEEIEKALKEFEAKETTQTALVHPPSTSINTENSKMVSFVIKHSGGMIKDQRQAEYILLGVVVVFSIISMFIFFGGNKNSTMTPEQQKHIKGLIETQNITNGAK